MTYRCHDRLAVEIYPDRSALGIAAARQAAACIHAAIARHGSARVVFACAPSQDEFLAALATATIADCPLDWSKVVAFHMDEYVGLTADHPASFRHYLQQHFLSQVKIGRFHPLPAENPNQAAVCGDYAAHLTAAPIDLICMGVGENGHIAFNDPPVADFADPVLVKQVELDRACRQQQVNDGCFGTLAEVPTHALTLTVPVFREARQLSIHVPGPRKARAVADALTKPISPACPASILRLHPRAALHLDPDSARLLPAQAGEK